ncbi:MAG: ABC-ATPase domain-containing protein [Proteobacteria bacterium]|nr:ABC-ATPase domain-containing protein [Pseudomonadota bacterium]
MLTETNLRNQLQRIDGKGYKAYHDIKGHYQFDDFTLLVDHVQGDPFAAPSRVRVQVASSRAAFPADLGANRSRTIAFCDYLTRVFYDSAARFAKGNRGTGKSGLITIDRPGQEILERTSVLVFEDTIEARFRMGLPAFGRRIAGKHAEEMFCQELPKIVCKSLYYSSLDSNALYRHVETSEDADWLRHRLPEHECIAFVADGAVLPRRTGIDPRPLPEDRAIPFESPDLFHVEMEVPNGGPIRGMGIPKGITLIVGGGYHGKSTLLSALETGIYNHIPGDGREYVVSLPDMVKIRAEDGRRVEKVGITPFIANLPLGKDTDAFSTDDASGSTSQAANILEALEIGAACLLIDEDTSATNFMIRDQRMQRLVAKGNEPITPFIDKVGQLAEDFNVSTVMVIGGCGDYFDVADRVICMNNYLPEDVTQQARIIARDHTAEREREGGDSFGRIRPRAPRPESLDPRRGRRPVQISEKGVKTIAFGIHTVDLSAVEQLVDSSQTRAIGDAMNLARKHMAGDHSLKTVVERISKDIEEKGLATLNSSPVGDYAVFRKFELAAAINRLRTLVADQLD